MLILVKAKSLTHDVGTDSNTLCRRIHGDRHGISREYACGCAGVRAPKHRRKPFYGAFPLHLLGHVYTPPFLMTYLSFISAALMAIPWAKTWTPSVGARQETGE